MRAHGFLNAFYSWPLWQPSLKGKRAMPLQLWPPWLTVSMSRSDTWKAVRDFCCRPRTRWTDEVDGCPETGALECIDWQGHGCTAVHVVPVGERQCELEVWRLAGDALVTARLQQSLACHLGAPEPSTRLVAPPAPSPCQGMEPAEYLFLPEEELAIVAWLHAAAGGDLSWGMQETLQLLRESSKWHVRMPARWALGLIRDRTAWPSAA